jgi:hypothetical protein
MYVLTPRKKNEYAIWVDNFRPIELNSEKLRRIDKSIVIPNTTRHGLSRRRMNLRSKSDENANPDYRIDGAAARQLR